MSKRPFPIQYRTAPSPAMLEIQAYFQVPTAWTPAQVKELESVFAAYAALGEVGGLGGSDATPAQSGLAETAHRVIAHELVWTFSATNLDPGALLVAANLLTGLHLRGFPIKDAAITSDLIRITPADRLELPVVFEPTPFEFAFEADKADILVDLEFLKDEPDEARAPYERAFEAWMKVAEFGGFSGAETSSPPGALFLMDVISLPSALEFVLENVSIDTQGFDSIVNAFHKLHVKGAKLESVVVQ